MKELKNSIITPIFYYTIEGKVKLDVEKTVEHFNKQLNNIAKNL